MQKRLENENKIQLNNYGFTEDYKVVKQQLLLTIIILLL